MRSGSSCCKSTLQQQIIYLHIVSHPVCFNCISIDHIELFVCIHTAGSKIRITVDFLLHLYLEALIFIVRKDHILVCRSGKRKADQILFRINQCCTVVIKDIRVIVLIQCVLADKKKEEELKKELDVLKTEHQGSLLLITARGTRREIMEKIQAKNPLFCEVLPLTLEEIFISETEVAGYDIKEIIHDAVKG